MLRLTLDPSTISLIEERMRCDGYVSPDLLLREALAALKPRRDPSKQTVPMQPPSTYIDVDMELQKVIDLDLSYESVPLKEARVVEAAFVQSGTLEMIPFDGNP